MRSIDKLVVHCSATIGGKDFHTADIDRWHRQQGWDGIGYHYVITLHGKVEAGRPVEKAGAHASGYNAKSVGVCLIGGVNARGEPAATFSLAQYAALESLLLQLRMRFPKAEILGHRDLPKVAKACPSFDVRAWCRNRGIKPEAPKP